MKSYNNVREDSWHIVGKITSRGEELIIQNAIIMAQLSHILTVRHQSLDLIFEPSL